MSQPNPSQLNPQAELRDVFEEAMAETELRWKKEIIEMIEGMLTPHEKNKLLTDEYRTKLDIRNSTLQDIINKLKE